MTAKELKEIVAKAKSNLTKAPKGNLRLSSSGGRVQYYNNRKYISKKNMIFIKQLAQKRFDIKVVKTAEQQIKVIESYKKKYKPHCIEDIYTKLTPALKKLVSPYTITDEEYVKQWSEEHYESKAKDGIFITSNNERVRSKSELIIADKLYTAHIPYRYEAQLLLYSKGKTVLFYPDFTILNTRTRQVYILEHFGMMDNPEYASKAVGKINLYANNGYIEGKNILYTFETSAMPMDISLINKLIETHLK